MRLVRTRSKRVSRGLPQQLEQIDPEIVVLLERVAERALRNETVLAGGTRAGHPFVWLSPCAFRGWDSGSGAISKSCARAQQRVSMDEHAGCACWCAD